jgi:dTMP kinase
MTEQNGIFITLEGVEGSGKTTQIGLLTQWLDGLALPYVLTREPGGTPFGRQVRQVLLDAQGPARLPLAELLLYLADRYQDLHERIMPALAEGRLVLCDRYHDATLAYQGFARGIPLEAIAHIAAALDIRTPDATILLDIAPERSLARAIQRNQTSASAGKEGRFEAEALDFHRRVREGYLRLAVGEPARFLVIDADRPPETVFGDILRLLAPLLAVRFPGVEPS